MTHPTLLEFAKECHQSAVDIYIACSMSGLVTWGEGNMDLLGKIYRDGCVVNNNRLKLEGRI